MFPPHNSNFFNCSCSILGDLCWSGMSDPGKGFSYACSPEDLRAKVPHAPNLADSNGRWPDVPAIIAGG